MSEKYGYTLTIRVLTDEPMTVARDALPPAMAAARAVRAMTGMESPIYVDDVALIPDDPTK